MKLKKKPLLFFYRPPSWIVPKVQLHVIDDSRMKDVLQLTAVIVMVSSVKKKNKMTPKV